MSDTTHALTAILVQDHQREQIQSEADQASGILGQLRDWPCDTEEDETVLAEILQEFKGRYKELEEKRKSITQPLNAAKRAVDALFRPARSALEEAERIIKGKLRDAADRREAARREALRLASEAAGRGDVKGAQAAMATIPTNSGGPDGVSYRYQWKWELVDIEKVPPGFLALNPATMKMYVSKYRTSDEIPGIPGIRFHRERTVVSQSG